MYKRQASEIAIFNRKDEFFANGEKTVEKIKNYNYTINSADALSEDEQIEWFEVRNNAGSRVSIIQMRFSKLKMYGIDIYKQYTSVYVPDRCHRSDESH